MSTPNGYNNPAYCHQYDSSVYDYQYVPEIDPDSPDLDDEPLRRQTKLVYPNFRHELSESEEFEGSDESNASIIIEECNNRRVTLICEKRHQTEGDGGEYCVDRNYKAAYYQDISLESENGYDYKRNDTLSEERGRVEERSRRHDKPLQPPVGQTAGNGCNRNYSGSNGIEAQTSYKRPRKFHRYEEIPEHVDDLYDNSSATTSVHRYAEISVDENGYPTLKKPIEVQKAKEYHTYSAPPTPQTRMTSKPRAISPPKSGTKFPIPATPSRGHQRTYSVTEFSANSPNHNFYSTSPSRRNSFEMAELSPPRSSDVSRQEQTYFVDGPVRQAPIGSARCIIPSHLQKTSAKIRKHRSYSAPNSPRKTRDNCSMSTPTKSNFDRKVKQIFHINPVRSNPAKAKTICRGKTPNDKDNNPARRNISNSFTDPPRESQTPKKKTAEPIQALTRSPYNPTAADLLPPKTAIITPIFQRKNQMQQQNHSTLSPKKTFDRTSPLFQSTGNIFKNAKDSNRSSGLDFQRDFYPNKTIGPSRIKRNQSVPNFAHTFAMERGGSCKRPNDFPPKSHYSKNMDFQYSPKKSFEHVSPLSKSKLSLINQSRSSWSNFDSDYNPRCGTCFILATIIHLVTATATCAITFYLLSKIGRRYYLDFGLLAGFVNFILGLLGFRSYCWRWLPNRNYVSGFVGLAAFSAITCAGLSYLIIVRPMAGDPILDILGGAICAVSVLTILLALTGLTMSGCCKTPPPDNRVTDI